MGATAPLAFLPAADDERIDRDTGRQGEHADSFGPPNLCALNDMASTSGAMSRTSTQHGACTASVCNTAWGATSRTTAATAAMSEIVPTSLFTVMTLTTPTDGSAQASASRSRSIRPNASVPTTTPSPRCSIGWRTAWCSAAEQTAPPETPASTVLSASVPQLVKMTEPGATPKTSATSSASSIAWRAARANRWEPLGLAYISPKYGTMDAIARSRIGVEAA
ncbi:MAG: hypothetical protein R2697_21310 [Ilumatobacteraceae bacterium]